MPVQLQVDNPKKTYLLGGTIRVPQDVLGKVRALPNSPLIFRDENLQVGVVDRRGGVGVRDLQVERDFSVQSEILSGVAESDKEIVNRESHGRATFAISSPRCFPLLLGGQIGRASRGTQSRDAREEIRNDRNDLIDRRRLRV